MSKDIKTTFEKKNITRIVAFLLSLFAIIYFIYQIYMFSYVPYRTESALIYDYTDQISITGIALKQEQVLDDTLTGIVRYNNMDSSKIVAGTKLATVYSNTDELKTNELISEKQELLNILTLLENQKDDIRKHTQNITNNIKQEQIEFVTALQDNNFIALNSISNLLLQELLKQEIVINKDVSYKDTINQLKNEIQQLSTSISSQGVSVNAPVSGYFTPKIDGLEDITYDIATKDLSVNAVKSLFNSKPNLDNKKIGKIITSADWNFLGVFDAKYIDKLKVGQEVELIFNSSYTVSAKIENISFNDGDAQGTVLLSSSQMSDDVVDFRVENPSIVLKKSSGLKVPRISLRINQIEQKREDGTTIKESVPGVYINMGQVVKFKRVNIKFETDDYIICSVENDKDYLQIYDEIILEGDGLYDGKPIR